MKAAMRIVVAAFVAIVFMSFANADDEDVPSAEIITDIERQVVAQFGIPELSRYNRIYAFFLQNGRKMVQGQFLLKTGVLADPPPEALQVAGIPDAFVTTADLMKEIFDGGCEVIWLYYELETKKVISIRDGDDWPVKFCAKAAANAAGAKYPSAKVIKEIERGIVPLPDMPELRDYKRYYAFDSRIEHPVVLGVFLAYPFNFKTRDRTTPVAGVSGAHVTTDDNLPTILDGDCAVLTIKYDVKMRLFLLHSLGIHDNPVALPYKCNGEP